MESSIHELLHKLRLQNSAMLGRKSAETLSAFLAGFSYARPTATDDARFLLAFNNWVLKHFKLDTTQGWAKIIASYCASDNEEMDLFWKLYDRYRSRPRQEKRLARVNGHQANAKKAV